MVFGHLVPDDTSTISNRVENASGGPSYVPVAGLASWLCLKSEAMTRRDKRKDAYDVVPLNTRRTRSISTRARPAPRRCRRRRRRTSGAALCSVDQLGRSGYSSLTLPCHDGSRFSKNALVPSRCR